MDERREQPATPSEPDAGDVESLRIGDVARLVGTTPRTIRYYEETGLLPESGKRPALLVDGLVVRFGDLEAVGGVSFAVAPGEVFGLLGPNGAGKTTTIRVLTTLLPPSEGRAMVAGHDVRTESLAVRASIGYI